MPVGMHDVSALDQPAKEPEVPRRVNQAGGPRPAQLNRGKVEVLGRERVLARFDRALVKLSVGQ